MSIYLIYGHFKYEIEGNHSVQRASSNIDELLSTEKVVLPPTLDIGDTYIRVVEGFTGSDDDIKKLLYSIYHEMSERNIVIKITSIEEIECTPQTVEDIISHLSKQKD